MAHLKLEKILETFNKLYSADTTGDKVSIPNGLTVGIVVDTDDPLQMGRLRIFCPALNDNPKKLHHIPFASYVSPFSGTINNSGFARGNNAGPSSSSGAIHYGFSAIPEQGAHVVVGCFDGDIQRRFWIGCIGEHQEMHTMHTGRWKWNGGGIPDGPLTSSGSPIEPQYTNLGKAFNGDRESREWRTRAAEYQGFAVREDIGQIPNPSKSSYLDEQFDKITEAEPDDWVKPIVGAHGYDWTGFKNLGAFLSARQYGWSTPGFHSFVMDDRPFNSRMKLRTTNGHQIILDDTNERIYISTYEGNSWIEMDACGNIDMYSKRRFSVHAEKDINFTSDETVRILGKKGIHLYAGFNESQPLLDSPPEDGEIRIQSEADMHVITRKNYRHLSFEDSLYEIGGKKCESIAEDLFLQVQGEINTITNTGDYNLTVSGNLNEIVQGDVNKLALGTMKNMSNGDAQMHSFGGKMDVGAQYNINMKSITQDITIEVVGKNEANSGGVFMKSPQSQFGLSDSGHFVSTNKKIKMKSKNDVEFEQGSGVETPQDLPLPDSEISGDCDLGEEPLSLEGFSGPDLAARAAYNAGFRGDALTTAVAIAGGESSYNPNAIGDTNLQSDKWGPSVGLFQIRTLNNPQDYTGVDAKRDINTLAGESNIQNNANVAFELSKGGTNFSPWTVFKTKAYLNYIDAAKSSVQSMCAGGPMSFAQKQQNYYSQIFGFTSGCGVSLSEFCLADLFVSSENLFKMTEEGLELQAKIDTKLKSVQKQFSNFLYDEDTGIIPKLQDSIFQQLTLTLEVGNIFGVIGGLTAGIGAIGDIISAAGSFAADLAGIASILSNPFALLPSPSLLGGIVPLIDLGFELPSESVCSLDIPFFEVNIDNTFGIDFNFEICGKTLL